MFKVINKTIKQYYIIYINKIGWVGAVARTQKRLQRLKKSSDSLMVTILLEDTDVNEMI